MTFTPISAVLNAEEAKQVLGDENVPKPILISLEILNLHTASLPERDAALDSSQSPTPEEFQSDQSLGSIKKGQTPEEIEGELRHLRKSMKEQEKRLQRLERQMGE